MVDLFVIRNRRQLQDMIDLLKDKRLPFRIAFQEIYPLRSVEFNDYLWGFIYTPIALFTGHTPEEVHEECKRKYNFKHDFVFNNETKRYDLVLAKGSTTAMSTKDIWEYAMQIRAEAEIELHITLPLPNEAFIPELNFEHENKTEEKKL